MLEIDSSINGRRLETLKSTSTSVAAKNIEKLDMNAKQMFSIMEVVSAAAIQMTKYPGNMKKASANIEFKTEPLANV